MRRAGSSLGPDAVEGERMEHGLRQEHVARAPPTVVELEAAQSPAQPPQGHGIRTTHRRGEDLHDVRGVQLLGSRDDVEGAAQEGEERPHGHLLVDGKVGRGGLEGDSCTTEHPTQRGGARATAHHHGHPRPGHAVEEVGRPQSGRDIARLLGGSAQEVGLDGSPLRGRSDLPVTDAGDDPDVAHDPEGRPHHVTPASVGPGEGQGAGVGPCREEEPRVGPPEGLGGGVGVTEQHEVDRTSPDDDLEEALCGRRELLRVVDDDEAQPRAQAVEGTGVGLQGVCCSTEDPRGVERAGGGEGRHLVVLAKDVGRRHPLLAAVLPAEALQVLRVQTQLDDPHEEVAELSAKGPGGNRQGERLGPRRARRGSRGVPREQLAEDDVLLRTTQQPWRRVPGQRRGLAEDREPERLVRASERGGGRATETRRDGIPQQSGGTAGRRQHEARVGLGLPLRDPVGHDLDGHGRRARAGTADHPQHRPTVVDDGTLALVEHTHAAVLQRGPAEDEHVTIRPRATDIRTS